jgi:pre-mRNA cleavage complex 2 protein Pcf11
MAQLRAKFVIIPAGEEAQPRKCPVCKETIKSEFQEDDEEWVWRNAISVKGKVRTSHDARGMRDVHTTFIKVYHATCHAEAVAANIARRRLDIGGTGSSRSTTPDPSTRASSLPRSPTTASGVKSEDQKPPASPPIVGSKRKANELEGSDSDFNAKRDDSPHSDSLSLPVKKEEDVTPPMKKLALQAV